MQNTVVHVCRQFVVMMILSLSINSFPRYFSITQNSQSSLFAQIVSVKSNRSKRLKRLLGGGMENACWVNNQDVIGVVEEFEGTNIGYQKVGKSIVVWSY